MKTRFYLAVAAEVKTSFLYNFQTQSVFLQSFEPHSVCVLPILIFSSVNYKESAEVCVTGNNQIWMNCWNRYLFSQKDPLYMFDWVLRTPLSFIWNKAIREITILILSNISMFRLKFSVLYFVLLHTDNENLCT